MKMTTATALQPLKHPAEEVTQFLMGFALDFDAREAFEDDKQGFLEKITLSKEAKEIIAEPDATTFLVKINATEVA